VVWLSADEQAYVQGAGLPVVGPAGGEDALERWAAVRDRRRERVAWCARGSCLRGFWSFLFDDDSSFDSAVAEPGFDAWDDGVPVCSDHRGGAAGRTRPPRPPEEPRHAVPERAPSPDDGERSEVAGDAPDDRRVEPWPGEESPGTEPAPVASVKPPVEELPSDTWAVASADALTDPTGQPAVQAKPSGNEESRGEEDPRSGNETLATSPWVIQPAPETEDAPAAEPSGAAPAPADSSSAPADSPSAESVPAESAPGDSAPAGSDPPSAPAEPAPDQDSGSSGDGAAAPEVVEAAAQRDPGSEPNR
jgi:hypothetical protein